MFSLKSEGVMKREGNYFNLNSFFLLVLTLLGGCLIFPSTSMAQPFFKGAKLCEECHEAETKIWEKKPNISLLFARCIGNLKMQENLPLRKY